MSLIKFTISFLEGNSCAFLSFFSSIQLLGLSIPAQVSHTELQSLVFVVFYESYYSSLDKSIFTSKVSQNNFDC